MDDLSSNSARVHAFVTSNLQPSVKQTGQNVFGLITRSIYPPIHYLLLPHNPMLSSWRRGHWPNTLNTQTGRRSRMQCLRRTYKPKTSCHEVTVLTTEPLYHP